MDWKIYKNLGGDSGIEKYQIGTDYIKVEFGSGKQTVYTYDYNIPGKDAVDYMKKLAEDGEGLNAYINKKVRSDYSSKE